MIIFFCLIFFHFHPIPFNPFLSLLTALEVRLLCQILESHLLLYQSDIQPQEEERVT